MNKIPLCEIECKHCHSRFYVCQSCYRCQRYCCDLCRTTAQKLAHRAARHKYRKTDKGKETHRKAEIRRRMRFREKNKKTVGDRSTTTTYCHTKLHEILPKQPPRCHFCGVCGVEGDFPHRGYGSKRKSSAIKGFRL